MEEFIKKMVYTSFRRAWEEDRGGPPPSPHEVYVTEVTQCLLKSWFQRTMGEKPDGEKAVVLVLGDDVHFLMRDYFPIGDGEVTAERELENGVKLRGRVDRLLEETIIEFKTVSRAPDKPLSHHVDQVQLYMWLFGRLNAHIVYVTKTNGEVRVFKVDRDEERIKELLERAKRLSDSLKSGKPPDPEPGWLCKYCEFTSICKGSTS